MAQKGQGIFLYCVRSEVISHSPAITDVTFFYAHIRTPNRANLIFSFGSWKFIVLFWNSSNYLENSTYYLQNSSEYLNSLTSYKYLAKCPSFFEVLNDKSVLFKWLCEFKHGDLNSMNSNFQENNLTFQETYFKYENNRLIFQDNNLKTQAPSWMFKTK